jgi:hypothetical protein
MSTTEDEAAQPSTTPQSERVRSGALPPPWNVTGSSFARPRRRSAWRLAANDRRLGDAHSTVGKGIPAIKAYGRALLFELASASLRRVVARPYRVTGDFRRAARFYR